MSKREIFLVFLFSLVTVVGISLIRKPLPKIQKREPVTASKKCPSGFILIADFCVMKYDAKCTNPNPKCVTGEGVYKNNAPGCICQGNFQIVSTASGPPITYVPEDDGTNQSAKSYCQNAGWHLMTNTEWMIIAKDVAQVYANWCNKDGTGCGNPPGTSGKILANGHNDLTPNNALPAGSDDQPCFGTTTDGSDKCGGKNSQKRTLTLSNGEVIWDFAGNIWQWVDETIARKDEPRSLVPSLGGNGWVWAEFQTVQGSDLYSPTNSNWDSAQGVGRIYHYNLVGDTDTTLYTFVRGGNWRHGYDSGVFTIHMQPVPGKTNIDDIGFRCVVNPI